MSNISSDPYYANLIKQITNDGVSAAKNQTKRNNQLGAMAKDAMTSAGSNIPIAGAFMTLGKGFDSIAEAAGYKWGEFNPDVAERHNISPWIQAANTAIKAFPGHEMFSVFQKKTKNFKINPTLQNINGYGGAIQTMRDAESLSGIRLLAGKNAANNIIDIGNNYQTNLVAMNRNQQKMNGNYMSQVSMAQNPLIYSGFTPGNSSIKIGKYGGTISELEEARSIMQSLQSKKQDIQEPQKFQLGGKMNMIVTGALHARKHNLEELNPNLEGEITKKGIPVVVMNEGGEVQGQQAEVESQELVLQIDTTKTIEDYYDEYNSTNSKTEKNKIALECGKYLVDELLKNTDDPDKLIKKTV